MTEPGATLIVRTAVIAAADTVELELAEWIVQTLDQAARVIRRAS